jgi:Putative peptidoglycan binding domain
MASVHTVQQGEHLSGIAEQYGFRQFESIWDHPKNADVKKKRKFPHVLLPGDELYIPDKEQKTESAPTTNVHRFIVPAQPLKLRIALTDFDNEPVANTDCELEVDGKISPLKSDGKGIVELTIARTAKSGTLRVPDLEIEIPLQIGHLDPLEEDTGWQARLTNLGYYAGPERDANGERLRYAIEEFQCDQKLSVTGELDGATQAKLKELHGI